MFKKLYGWYFSKSVLPFWCVLLIDGMIVFLSCLFTYWLDYRTGEMFENRYAVFYTGGCVKICTSSYLFFYRHGVERFLLRYFFDVKSVTSTREAAFCVI